MSCDLHDLLTLSRAGFLHAGADNSRTMRARSGVIEVVHDALHELGVYTPANRDNSPSLHEAED